MSIPVAKYQGAGNDFVLAREVDVLASGLDAAAFAAAVCDRHTGIGADGAILAGGEAAGGTGPVWMHYHNADGSVAPMCGNGIRCLAAYLLDEGMVFGRTVAIETLAGTKTVERVSDEPFLVRVDMGRPDWSPAALGISGLDEPIVDATLDLGAGREATITSLFMATDHTVVLSDDAFDDANMGLGRAVCESPFFPRQTNVNFVQPITRKRLLVRTFERGVGPTLACGTGVCASAVVAHEQGLADASVDVTVPGGELHIDIDESGEVYMTGGATRIMRGEWFQ
jgi:diaminopimelate epimerase